ncbi:MAG: hypothetical protein LBI88_03220, partial [Deltaproteobacteria bacterium]|nr:hypothetical protein [Deltaproteobacteria bacterium]
MTSTPQNGNQQSASFFSNAWGKFAQTRDTAPPSAVIDAPEEAGHAIRHADAPPQETPVTDATQHIPSVEHSLAATAAASVSIETQVKPGFSEGCFNGLSYIAFLALPLLLLAQFAVGLSALTPWLFPQEARFAESYELMAASGQWLMAPAALPPVWFWLLRLLNTLPYVDGPVVYAAGAACAAVLT